jgi:hypothetical protein
MSNSIINTPEFWEQVKQEYKPENNPEHLSSFCFNSHTFSEVWNNNACMKIHIQSHAKSFLNQGGFNDIQLGGTFLFFYIHGHSLQKMRAVRHAFIEYMIEKTKKNLQL